MIIWVLFIGTSLKTNFVTLIEKASINIWHQCPVDCTGISKHMFINIRTPSCCSEFYHTFLNPFSFPFSRTSRSLKKKNVGRHRRSWKNSIINVAYILKCTILKGPIHLGIILNSSANIKQGSQRILGVQKQEYSLFLQ